jgi:TfoX/Sxy family transcriptional regulator of competence genes
MAYDLAVAERFRAALNARAEVQEKHMFGALGFMINGKLAVCVGSDDVMFRLSSEECNRLIEQGIASPVTMGKRTMKNWVNIDFDEVDKDFTTYLDAALEQTD